MYLLQLPIMLFIYLSVISFLYICALIKHIDILYSFNQWGTMHLFIIFRVVLFKYIIIY